MSAGASDRVATLALVTARAPRIGIVVTDAYAPDDPDPDTPLLLHALRQRGAEAAAVVWHDERIDLAAFDLLILRSPWDYPDRLDEFRTWLDRAGSATRVLNAPETVRWNLDKRYLAELEGAGVRVVPTVYAASADAAATALATHDTGDGPATDRGTGSGARVVVKPAVSAAARDTGLFAASDPRALALATRIVEAGGVAMIQPEIGELTDGHERALYLVDGVFTHAIAKGALLAEGGGLRGGVYVENPVVVDATPAEHALAQDALRAVRALTGGSAPLYARVDVVTSAAFGPCVLEVELIEPSLNLHVAPEAIAVVAEAILRAAGDDPDRPVSVGTAVPGS